MFHCWFLKLFSCRGFNWLVSRIQYKNRTGNRKVLVGGERWVFFASVLLHLFWCVLTIFTWKNLCFTEKIHLNARLAASEIFPYVYTIICLIRLSYRCLKNVIHQVDSSIEWLLLSVTFTAKLELVFVLTFENAFS